MTTGMLIPDVLQSNNDGKEQLKPSEGKPSFLLEVKPVESLFSGFYKSFTYPAGHSEGSSYIIWCWHQESQVFLHCISTAPVSTRLDEHTAQFVCLYTA